MSAADSPQWTANGIRLRIGAGEFGELETCACADGDPERARAQIAADGYLLLRGFLPVETVARARDAALQALHSDGLLDSRRPAAEAWPASRVRDKRVLPALGKLPEVQELVHAPRLASFFAGLLGGTPRVLEQVLLRMIPPAHSTTPHCDIVYMGRGTPRLFTAWMPLGNVPRRSGALMILERSHLLEQLSDRYWKRDADRERILDRLRIRHGRRVGKGKYSNNPRGVAGELRRRWLTTDFAAGDVLVFSAFTMHCSLDNVSDRVRVSVDARWQLASEPADERWIGSVSGSHAEHG